MNYLRPFLFLPLLGALATVPLFWVADVAFPPSLPFLRWIAMAALVATIGGGIVLVPLVKAAQRGNRGRVHLWALAGLLLSHLAFALLESAPSVTVASVTLLLMLTFVFAGITNLAITVSFAEIMFNAYSKRSNQALHLDAFGATAPRRG